MTTTTKTSTALMIAWLVLIAGLIGAIMFFTLNGRQAPTEPDAPVVPVQVKPRPPAEKKPSHPVPGRSHSGQDTSVKETTISGVVHAPTGEVVGGAHVAIFAWSGAKAGQPSVPPDMDEIKLINQMIYITPEDWDTPRSLGKWTGGDDDASRADGSELVSADTKDDGSFTITLPPHLGTGPFRLTAQKTGVGSASISDVKAGAVPLEITLGPEANVTGTVVTEVDSVPVEGARVSFDSGARRLTATTGPGGKFTVEGVTPGRYELVVAAKGKTPLFEPTYTVHPNDTVPVTLRMPRGTLLRVKAVLDKADEAGSSPKGGADGDPVANAQIAAYCEDAGIYVLGKTNASGVVEFAGVPAGRYALNGLAPGVVSVGEEQIVIDRNQLTQEQTVSFEPAVDTPVEVVDEDGRPVAGVDFYTVNSDEKYDSLRSLKTGTTDSEGKLKFAFEFDGPRSAMFGFKPGYALVRAYPDDNSSGDPIRLVAKKPIRVHGSVKTTDGRAIPDTVVAISISPAQDAADDMELEIRADKDGHYDFPYLPHADGITISATAPDGISQEDQDLELVAGQTDYTVDLSIEFDEPVTPPTRMPKRKPDDGLPKPPDPKPPK